MGFVQSILSTPKNAGVMKEPSKKAEDGTCEKKQVCGCLHDDVGFIA
jgi:hypothetical protein